jgi:hypothetical protein
MGAHMNNSVDCSNYFSESSRTHVLECTQESKILDVSIREFWSKHAPITRILYISSIFLTALFFCVAMFSIVSAVEEAPALSSKLPNATAVVSNVPNTAVFVLSEYTQALVRTLFRLPPEMSIDLGSVVILSVLWLCFFIVLLSAYRLTPFFERGISAWLAAFITVWLIAAASVLSATLAWLQSIQQGIQGLTASALAAWMAVLAIVVFLSYCFFVLSSFVRNKARVNEAEREGIKLGAGI